MVNFRNRAVALVILLCVGCTATTPSPLTYLALERPTGRIITKSYRLETQHSRGGLYFLNWGFRPAPDIAEYLRAAHAESGAPILRDADVELRIPIAFDIILFGYNHSNDVVRASTPKE